MALLITRADDTQGTVLHELSKLLDVRLANQGLANQGLANQGPGEREMDAAVHCNEMDAAVRTCVRVGLEALYKHKLLPGTKRCCSQPFVDDSSSKRL